MDDRPPVFVTGAGGAGTVELLRSLRATGRYTLIAVDPSRYAGGFVFADRCYRVPMAIAPDYGDVTASILRKEQPSFIVPLVDEEILSLHQMALEVLGGRARVVAPNPTFCKAMLDKWRCYETLNSAAIPVPASWLGSDTSKVRFPAIVKPRLGRGSRGLRFLESARDLDAYLVAASRPPSEYIVQERVDGTEFTVSAVVTLDDDLLAVVPKEVIHKQGSTVVGVTRFDPQINSLVRKLHDRLRPSGPFNVQLIRALGGTAKVIEVNPRYSTTVALTIGAGIDEVDVVLRDALGESVGPLHFRPDLLMVRYTSQFVVAENEWPVPTRVGPSRGLRAT
jgi:carbamoyl-phosphate synthase large subunit